MPRPPLQRTCFSLLPILGALLAALAAAKGWPMMLSLLAMTIVAASAAVIYWSAPLPAFHTAAPTPTVADSPVQISVERISAAADPEPETESVPETSEPLSAGTRAEALATGHWRDTDLLTGLLNPDIFFERVATELERCATTNQTAILVICDVDGFSAINESAGLAEANHLLRRVAECFRLKVREGDVLARLGGDEFGIFFPGLPHEIAVNRARDLRAAVREAGLQVLEDDSPQVTACIGISSYPEDGYTVHALLGAANASLAAAKLQRQQDASPVVASVPRLLSRS